MLKWPIPRGTVMAKEPSTTGTTLGSPLITAGELAMGQRHRKFIDVERLHSRSRRAILPEPPARSAGPRGTPNASRLGEIIADTLAGNTPREPDHRYQVFLLTGPDDSATLRLPGPISHRAPSAWTQHQRYTLQSALETKPTTTEELSEAETAGASDNANVDLEPDPSRSSPTGCAETKRRTRWPRAIILLRFRGAPLGELRRRRCRQVPCERDSREPFENLG
jgi:hypothetical protein